MFIKIRTYNLTICASGHYNWNNIFLILFLEKLKWKNKFEEIVVFFFLVNPLSNIKLLIASIDFILVGLKCETEVNECIPDPCQNGGQCSDLIGQFKCNCTSGYYGDTCQFQDGCFNQVCTK